MMLRHPFITWISLSLLAVVITGCSGLAGEPLIVATMPPQPTAQTISVPQSAPDLAAGAQVYAANCTRCHGATGKGDGEMVTSGKVTGVADFTDPKLSQDATPADWYEIVTNGRMDKLMPPWGGKLSDTQRWDVTNYVYSLGKPNTSAEIASAPTTVAGSTNTEPAVTQDANTAAQPATTADPNASVNTNGIVGGKVVNLTSGSSLPTDLALTLYVVSGQNSQAPQQVLNTKMKPDGSYQFDNVPVGSDQHYVVMATYKDTVYTSDMVPSDPTHLKVDLPVKIYEVGDNATNVKISEMVTMMQVNPTANELQVVQIVSFTNDSDHAYLKTVDGASTSTSVKLPKGATFQDFSSGKYKLSADGTQVFDTEPVMPGSPHIMHLGYTLPYTGQMSIDQPIDYALNGKVQVMVANQGLSITGDQFVSLGTSQLGSQTYQSFGGDFTRAAGESLRYDLTGSLAVTNTASTAATVSGNNIISPLAYILIAIGLVAIGTAIGFFMRERTDQRSNPQLQTNELMKQIADLDVRHNEGKINEAQYLKQRTALKSQLVALMKNKSKATGD